MRPAAEILGLTNLLDRYPRQLSGGQRQRVAMGRAIVRDPQVFLFDEPLSNLDAKLRVSMRAEIKNLHQRLKTTTVYVTHDQIEAMTMADKIVVMHDGRVEQVGAPLDLYDMPANLFVAGFIGSPAMNMLTGRIDGGDGGRFVTGDGAGAAGRPAAGGRAGRARWSTACARNSMHLGGEVPLHGRRGRADRLGDPRARRGSAPPRSSASSASGSGRSRARRSASRSIRRRRISSTPPRARAFRPEGAAAAGPPSVRSNAIPRQGGKRS